MHSITVSDTRLFQREILHGRKASICSCMLVCAVCEIRKFNQSAYSSYTHISQNRKTDANRITKNLDEAS